MSLKLKALMQAVGIFLFSIFAGVTVSTALSKIPVEAIPWIAMAGLAGIAVHLLYGLRLSSLQHTEALKRISESNEHKY